MEAQVDDIPDEGRSVTDIPDEERQQADPPGGLPDDTPPTRGTRTENSLFNQEKFNQVKASKAWLRQPDAGLGIIIGIMEEVNSFHPDFQDRIHENSVLTSPYPESDPTPPDRYITDMTSFMQTRKYPKQPCLLQYAEYRDCPDQSGNEKYFLRHNDGSLGQLPSLEDPNLAVTVEGNAATEPEFSVGHGTGVASVAAAGNDDGRYAIVDGREQSLQGIAYDANILVYARPVKIAGLSASFEDHAEYFRNAPKEADVYNFSHVFGTRVTDIGREFGNDVRNSGFAAIARAIRDMGRPLIASTGNEGRKGETFPRFPAALPLFFSYLRGQVLAVTAIGTNGGLTRYANPCGALPSDWNTRRDGRHYCIAAPGGEPGGELAELFLVAGPTNDLYNYNSGTSFATPMVAGAFAILKKQFQNNMSDKQLLDRLMETASRAGRYANSDIYGAGLLDLDAATGQVGTTSVSIAGDINEGIIHDFDSTLLSTSTAFGDSLNQALQDHEIAAFDELGAPFWYPFNTLTAEASWRANLQTRYARLNERIDAPVPILTGGQLSLTSKRADELEQMDMSLRQPVDVLDIQAELLFAAGDLSTAPFGLHEDESFAHPYLGFAGEGVGFGGAINIGAGHFAAMGFASGGGSGAFTFQDTPPINAHGGLLEYAFEPVVGATLGFQTGALVEESRALGLLPQGGFGEIGVSSTAFVGVSLDGELRESWHFRAQALGGWTNLPVPSDGLFASGANSASSAFRFALEGRDVFFDADRFDAFVAQPLRIESGEVDFIIPVARTPSGSITRERIDGISLEPSGRELEFGTRYEMQVREGIVATGGVGIVREGGHVGAQETEIYGLGNLSFHF